MPQKNGYKSHRGRSAIARRTEFGGASGTNGIMPGVYVTTTTGKVVRTSYFGGPKKVGLLLMLLGLRLVLVQELLLLLLLPLKDLISYLTLDRIML